MKIETTTFFSDGLKLSGTFYWPDDAGPGPHPLVVPCSGFTGLNAIHPARFARYLTARGQACFGFDYRGFAGSEGPRGRVLLEEQARDIIHAATFAAADPRVDAARLVLLGWGMGGGLVIDAARTLRDIAGLVCVNGFYVGARVQRAHRGEDGLRAFEERAAAERAHRVATNDDHETDPFDLYPLDEQSRRYVDNVLRKAPNYDAQPYSWRLADSLLRFDVEAHAPRLAAPLLVCHGEKNALHPPAEATAFHAAYGGPKDLYWIPDAGHTEFMADDNPTFQALAARIADWLNGPLAA
jgi:hypothetical protein